MYDNSSFSFDISVLLITILQRETLFTDIRSAGTKQQDRTICFSKLLKYFLSME